MCINNAKVFTCRKPNIVLLYVLGEQLYYNEWAFKLVYMWELVPDS